MKACPAYRRLRRRGMAEAAGDDADDGSSNYTGDIFTGGEEVLPIEPVNDMSNGRLIRTFVLFSKALYIPRANELPSVSNEANRRRYFSIKILTISVSQTATASN